MCGGFLAYKKMMIKFEKKPSVRFSEKKKKNYFLIYFLTFFEIVILAVILLFVKKSVFSKEERVVEVKQQRLTATSANHSAWIKKGKLYIAGEKYHSQDVIKKWKQLIQVAISDDHIIALDQSGTVYATGLNASYQCEINGLCEVSYIEAGNGCSIAVMNDGTIQVFGILDAVMRQELLTEENVETVALGDQHVAVLHKNGTVSAYGKKENGQCDVTRWKNIQQIDVGYTFTIGLNKEGKIIYAGDDSYGTKNSTKWKSIVKIAAGNNHVLGINEQGMVCAAGRNSQAECNVQSWEAMISISAGYDHSIGINTEGNFFAIGFNGNGQCDI